MAERRRGSGSPGGSGRGSPYDHAPRRVPAHSTVPVASDSVRLRDVDTSGSADSPAGIRDIPLLNLGSGGMVPPDTAAAAQRRAMLAQAVPKSEMAARTPSRSQEARPTYRLVDEQEMREAVAGLHRYHAAAVTERARADSVTAAAQVEVARTQLQAEAAVSSVVAQAQAAVSRESSRREAVEMTATTVLNAQTIQAGRHVLELQTELAR